MLNLDKLAVITLHTVISQLMKGDEAFSPDTPQAGMCVRARVERLGEATQAEVNLARLRQRARRVSRDRDAEVEAEAAGFKGARPRGGHHGRGGFHRQAAPAGSVREGQRSIAQGSHHGCAPSRGSRGRP